MTCLTLGDGSDHATEIRTRNNSYYINLEILSNSTYHINAYKLVELHLTKQAYIIPYLFK